MALLSSKTVTIISFVICYAPNFAEGIRESRFPDPLEPNYKKKVEIMKNAEAIPTPPVQKEALTVSPPSALKKDELASNPAQPRNEKEKVETIEPATKILNSCQCDLDKFFQQFLKTLIRKSSDQFVRNDTYMIRVNMTSELRSELRRYIQSGNNVQIVSSSLAQNILSVSPENPELPDDETWQFYLNTEILTIITQIAVVIASSLYCLVKIYQIYRHTSLYKFIFFTWILLFIINVPWTWYHLYKRNLAGRIRRLEGHGMNLPPECQPENLPVFKLIYSKFSSHYENQCQIYYEDSLIDPFWEVKPMQALTATLVATFWQPLEDMGAPLGVFIKDVLEPLPWYIKPFIAVFGLVFLMFIALIKSNLKIWTWFFTIEPANPHPAQQNQQLEGLREIRQMLEQINQKPIEERRNGTEIVTAIQNKVEAAIGPAGDAPSTSGLTPALLLQDSLPRIDHIVLTTENRDNLINFYLKLGMTLIKFNDGTRTALKFGRTKFNIHEREKTEDIYPLAARPCPGSLDICLICERTVEKTQQFLEDSDIEVLLGPVQRTGALGPITSIYCSDPDGNLVELGHYNDIEDVGH